MKERYVSQCRFLLAHRYRYYVLDDPILQDHQFDKAMKVLEEIEKKCPELVNSYSPTQYPEEPPCGWVRWFKWNRDDVKAVMFGPE